MEQEKKDKKKKEKPKKSLKREIFEWVMVFVVAAALAFVVRTFIFEPVRVDGSSMLNTLEDSEFMIATKFDYLMGDPERFDIVICDYPNTDDGMYRVKRVIGLPGETIELKKGELYVNGEHVEQQFDMTPNETDFGPFTVPEIPGLRMVIFSALLMAIILFYRQGFFGSREFSWNGLFSFVRSLPGRIGRLFRRDKKEAA